MIDPIRQAVVLAAYDLGCTYRDIERLVRVARGSVGTIVNRGEISFGRLRKDGTCVTARWREPMACYTPPPAQERLLMWQRYLLVRAHYEGRDMRLYPLAECSLGFGPDAAEKTKAG